MISLCIHTDFHGSPLLTHCVFFKAKPIAYPRPLQANGIRLDNNDSLLNFLSLLLKMF